jgi:hypothetical protein
MRAAYGGLAMSSVPAASYTATGVPVSLSNSLWTLGVIYTGTVSALGGANPASRNRCVRSVPDSRRARARVRRPAPTGWTRGPARGG